MNVKLLTEHHLEFLSLTGGCKGSSESTLVKVPHCWTSHVAAQMILGQLIEIELHTVITFSTRECQKVNTIMKYMYHNHTAEPPMASRGRALEH